jgi:heterodisulfide reductase subunit D
MGIDERAVELGISGCVTCGRCTWACLVSRRPGDFSPRTVAERFLKDGTAPDDGGIWSCTNCGMCTQVCDSGVIFHEFVRDLRAEVRSRTPPEMTHGGILPTISRLSSMPHLKPRADAWVKGNLDLDPRSGTLLFLGCIPHFDVIFRDFRDDILEIPRAAVSLLSAMGEKPAVMREERCCGHDAYWMGEDETLERLASLNVESIEKRGTEEVVFLCPEGYWTFKEIYPKLLGPLGFEVRSLTEVVGKAVEEGSISLRRGVERIAFQDPCRLGRCSGILDAPRKIIDEIGERVDMGRSERLAACCGHSNWVNCDAYTREWQLQRLEEASSAGAEVLATACPKCLIHLSCAQRNLPDADLKIMDIHVMAAEALEL